ncbi:transporter substrate-binding domain-containing protein [Burkholderia sp. IDO3]|uniref:transporter substrate-binding domain-containing protein n=1 Tax=Burkholderia sp. IDO3 TaxID=1705310 RepID=UPI000BBABEDB|nr:transporter substrate-binding domain-containing protein [Burkholderia sp. IDO3]AXK65145.1 amino acid ABC transporter substrate-binding protein [Burkholderia sp. IDO3]PCD61757.1 ABC transporter substrate-binding protein [Burkholderia sp. IDO3]
MKMMLKQALSIAGTALTLAAFAPPSTYAAGPNSPTLDRIKARGNLICPVPTSPYLGFFEVGSNGSWHGLDVDICKSIATAILGPNPKVSFSAVSWADRFPALQSGSIDLIAMFTSWTRSRDAKLGLQFSNPYLFAGVRLMVPASLKIKSAKELDGATICAVAGSTGDKQLVNYLRSLNVKYKMLTFENFTDVVSAYKNHRCDALSAAGPGLAVLRAGELKTPEQTILPDIVSMEPTSVAVRQGDDAFLDVINWTFGALIEAQRLGITQENVAAKRADRNSSAEVKYLLGVTPGVGEGLGLPDAWAYNVIKQMGNYSEIYARNLGDKSPYKLPPGQNTLWSQGGLLFSPTFD